MPGKGGQLLTGSERGSSGNKPWRGWLKGAVIRPVIVAVIVIVIVIFPMRRSCAVKVMLIGAVVLPVTLVVKVPPP